MTHHKARIPKVAVRKLLADNRWVKDAVLSNQMIGSTVYVDADEAVLEVLGVGDYIDFGCLYPNKAAFENYVSEFMQKVEEAKKRGPQHVLKGRLPQGRDFTQHVPQLIDDLAKKLKIPRDQLDRSYASLGLIDQAMKKKRLKQYIELPLCPMLIAYFGDVMRQQTPGKWMMQLSFQDGETWEPWIIDPEGYTCSPWHFLFDSSDEGIRPSIRYATGNEVVGRYMRVGERRAAPTSLEIEPIIRPSNEEK